jgi:hypothetical protein
MHVGFWSSMFMQGFSAICKTSGQSLSSTLWQDHEARHKSSNEVNMTPRSSRTKLWRQKTPRTWTENVEACTIRSTIQTVEKLTPRTHMQKGERSRRHEKHHRRRRPRSGSKWAQAGRPNPFWHHSPIVPLLKATHQFIRHSPSRSREERDTIPERRGLS